MPCRQPSMPFDPAPFPKSAPRCHPLHDRSRRGAVAQADIVLLPSADRNGRFGRAARFHSGGIGAGRQPRPGDAQPRRHRRRVRRAPRARLHDRASTSAWSGVMAITASGIVGLLLALPGATPIVIALSSAYFAYLAYRIATAPPLAEAGGAAAPAVLSRRHLSCRWSIPRAMPRWRPCSPASC